MTGPFDEFPRPEDLPEGWEDWLAFFAAQLPQPLDRDEVEGVVTFVAGDPGEVIVQLTPHVIRVAEYVASREAAATRGTPGATGARARWLGRIYWQRMPPTAAISVVESLVGAARETRRSRFRTCPWCERHLPPEQMLDETTCRRCAAESPEPLSDREECT